MSIRRTQFITIVGIGLLGTTIIGSVTTFGSLIAITSVFTLLGLWLISKISLEKELKSSLIIVVILFLTLIPVPAIQLLAVAIMYSSMIFIGVNGFLMSRKIKKLVTEKFPGEPTKGLGLYGWMRSTQLRRLRAPAPQVGPVTKK